MKGKPRKTATFTTDTKEKSIIEAQKYEIDKKQIYDFYGITPKKERKYNVIKKQIAFGKDSAFKKIDKNKKYSNYLVFRELLQKEYDIEDIKSEIEQVKLLINLSENTRDEFYRFFQFDRADYNIHNGETTTPTKIGIGMKGDAINTDRNADDNRKRQMGDIVLSVNDFIRKCKMLRRKRDEDENNDKSKVFKVYSDLNIPSNKFACMNHYYSNKNKLNNKYYLEKELLIKCFNREERFINFNNLIKESYIKEAPDSLNLKTKDKYSSYYFDIIFDKREEFYYEQYDNFFSKYNISSFKLKNEEAELYGKIYGILCKNNYMKFLSYLYSKNDIFKFIYDEFSDKDATISNFSLENSLASQIQYKIGGKAQSQLTISESFSDNKLKQKELGISSESNKKDTTNNINITGDLSDEDKNLEKPKKAKLIKQISNSYLFIKIGFLNKIIKEKIFANFFKDDEDEESEEEEKQNDKNSNNDNFMKYLEECFKIPMDNILLITSGKNFKIIDNKYNQILGYKMSKIHLIKINKELLKHNQYSDNLQGEYYIVQILKRENQKDYYLFKIDNKYINLFDNKIKNNFKLESIKDFTDNYDKDKGKHTKKKRKEKSSKRSKRTKKTKKDKEKNKGSDEDEKISIKKKEKERFNIDNSKDDNQKSHEKNEHISPIPSSFNQNVIESDNSSKNSGKKASIFSECLEEKIDKVIKDSNKKKTSKYQSEHKNYEFIIDNEKYSFDIIKEELRCKRHNKEMKKYPLSEITPQKVQEDKENSCYQLNIINGDNNIIFKILNQDKSKLENFYFDLIETKRLIED